jgi:hypothetical protein
LTFLIEAQGSPDKKRNVGTAEKIKAIPLMSEE